MIGSGNKQDGTTIDTSDDFENDAVNIGATPDSNTQASPGNFQYRFDPGNNNFSTANNQQNQKPSAPAYFNQEDEFKVSQEQAKDLGSRAYTFVQSHGGTHLLLLLASFLLLVKAASDEKKLDEKFYDKKGIRYAIFVAVVSIVITAVHFYATKKAGVMNDHVAMVFLIILVVIWTIAVGALTFGTTYNTTGNGFFACWFGFLLSLALLSESNLFKSQNVNTQMVRAKFKAFGYQLGTLLLSSIVLFFASLSPCHQNCDGATKYGIVISIITVFYVFAVFNFIEKFGQKVRLAVFGVMMALWIAVVFVGTFSGPFNTTGNGYFACWFGAIASILLFHKVYLANFTLKSSEGKAGGKNVDMV